MAALSWIGFAQAQTTVNVARLIDPWLEIVLAVVGVAIAALVGWIAAVLKRKLGFEIEANHREALQTALTMGAGWVLSQAHKAAATTEIDVHNAYLKEGIEYVATATPEALLHFNLTPEAIAQKLSAKIAVLTAPANIVLTTTSPEGV
jgi:hypothetical protein